MDLLLNCFAFGAITATAINDRVVKLGFDEYYKMITTTTTTNGRKSATNTSRLKRNKFYLCENNVLVKSDNWMGAVWLCFGIECF
jgi:hypothetical protein